MGKLSGVIKIAEYFVKPGKRMLTSNPFTKAENFSCTLSRNAKGNISEETMAKLGDASVWISADLRGMHKEAALENKLIFGRLSSVGEQNVVSRAKGELSVLAKLEKSLVKNAKDNTFTDLEHASSYIQDGIGSRVFTNSLPKLSEAGINTMIKNMRFEGQPLTAHQEKLLRWYINDVPMKNANRDEAFALFEEFAKPLVEKRSAEVVDELTLGILQHRIDIGEVSIAKLEQSGLFNETIIARLKNQGDIIPINITEINNYRGKYGLSEFSNAQIRQLSMAVGFDKASNTSFKIISDPRGLGYMQYPPEELEKLGKESIKASGYRTAQINVVHSNGALGEIQFRGKYTNMIGECEHMAYDIRQGKGTLAPEFYEYEKAIKMLDDKQYSKYNEYLEACYNYYNRLELGLPAVKPKLPKGFKSVLSEENMQKLHDIGSYQTKVAEQGFTPHVKHMKSYAA